MDNFFAKTNDNFIKSRGDAVEEKTIHLFSQLFPGAIFYKKVCEKPGNFEHDIVIDYKEYYFIVEVKASKLRMPLYNPEKSAIRVKDHFFSEVGIGYAYKQCIELKKRFDKKVNLALFIDKNKSFVFKPKNKIVPIIVTLENFGAIQINYSDLLIPESGQPYAWSINIPDLENIIEINKYLSKGPSSFIDYISFRLKHFKEIKASDELEILELFYKNKIKGLKKDTTYFIEPSGKSLIDKIYFEKNGVPYDYSIKEFNLK